MATGGAVSEDGLDFWLNKCTNVLSQSEDWEAIVGFCDRINKEADGPQTALKLLVHKIQSPQEKESLLALITLEACVKNCGRRFQQEVGKFRFLNEIIKVISPKFLGNMTSQRVKDRCIELLYNWSEVLEYEPKIKEAYQMLRRQGIVKHDPIGHDRSIEPIVPPPPPPPRASIFDNDEKSKLLSRLLKSKNPDDLIAANRLIKNMVKQDAERTEKLTQRMQQLDVTYNNVKLLTDMLRNYQPDNATESDKEIMKELYDNLEKQRPKLFRLASETDESDDSGITDILKANDEVIRVMALYEDTIHKPDVDSLLIDHALGDAGHGTQQAASVERVLSGEVPPSYTNMLLDDQLLKLGLDGGGSGAVSNGVVHESTQIDDFNSLMTNSTSATTTPSTLSTLDEFLGPTNPPSSSVTLMPSSVTNQLHTSSPVPVTFQSPTITSVRPTSHLTYMQQQQPMLMTQTALNSSLLYNPASSLQPKSADAAKPDVEFTSASGVVGAEAATSGGLASLDALGQSALEQSLSGASSSAPWITRQQQASQSKIPMNQMIKPADTAADSTSSVVRNDASSAEIQPLTDVFVSLESIQPGEHGPIIAYFKNNIKVVFHIGKDRPRPDIVVIAVSVMSTNTSTVKAFTFQAAVPKVMKVKLQPASATDLPAHNPILPPAAITQVMLIAHRPQDKILLKFKISYSLNDSMMTDIGEVQFPDGI